MRTRRDVVLPPALQVVLKGWIFWAERRAQPEALERLARLRERRLMKRRPWWRGLNQRWRRL